MGVNDPQDMAHLDPRDMVSGWLDLCKGSLNIATCV